MTGPLISVIIPVYNAEKYLRKAVNSVINQTYTNLEIILIDDNSKDDSLSICRSFDDPRIRIISNPVSLGAAGARNKGLDVFTGEYVAFVDADDYVHPEYIALLYKALTESGADISCCGFLRTFGGIGAPCVNKKTRAKCDSITTSTGLDAALSIVERKSMYYVVFWNKLYKRSIWDGLRLPTGKRAEDFYTSYIFLSRAEKVAFIGVPLYYYLQQKKSVMHIFDDFSIYMEEALDGFDSLISERLKGDEEKLKKYSALSLIFRTDTVVEDYWKAYKKKDTDRMEKTLARALLLRRDMVMRDITIPFKFNLFYGNRFLYKIGRRLFDIKEAIAITLHRDKEGTLS